MDGRVLRRKRGDSISRRKLTAIYALTVAIGLWLGLLTEPYVYPQTHVVQTQYPVMLDVEPTLNKHARQTFHADALSKRKAIVVARKQAVVSVSRSAEPTRQAIVFEATAYVALCNTGCTGITRTGVDVRNTIYYAGHRIIAVDPNVIPLGSLVRVTLADGTTFTATAQDTGGHIVRHRIDLLVSSEREAWAFGRQNVGIKILRNGAIE